MRALVGLVVIVGMSSHAAFASVCDFRPSNYIGSGGTGAVAASSGAVAGAGATGYLAGLYTFTHAVTGATMLGSTAGGASAAGTVGIMGGTAGAGAAAVGLVLNPFVWVTAAAATVGIGALEGGCYLAGD
jgi:hypothetical protein